MRDSRRAPFRSQTESMVVVGTQVRVLIYAIGLINGGQVDISNGFEELNSRLKSFGFKDMDIRFLKNDVSVVEANKPRNYLDIFESQKKKYMPAELLAEMSSNKESATQVLAKFVNNEIEGIIDDDDFARQQNNKDGLRKIVQVILDSPERERFLLYMHAHLDKDKFLKFMSVCMDSKSLRGINEKFREINRFDQLNDDKNLYGAFSDLIRKEQGITNLLSSNLKNKKFDSVKALSQQKKGLLKMLMISPDILQTLVLNRMGGNQEQMWRDEALKKANHLIDAIPEDTRKNLSAESISELKEKYIKDDIGKMRVAALHDNKKEISMIYKALFSNYVSKENRDAFNSAYNQSPMSALKYIRADCRFNPFMYARVFVDGLAQEYMLAIDKLSPGQVNTTTTTTGGKIAKGIITAVRTVIALPLRILADPVSVVNSIGVSLSPISKKYRQWKENRGKSVEEKFSENAADKLKQLQEKIKAIQAVNGNLSKKDLDLINSYINNNIANFRKAGLIDTNSLGQDSANSDLLKKVADVASGKRVDFTAQEISILCKHIEKRIPGAETNFENNDFTALGAVQNLVSQASTAPMRKVINKIQEETNRVPALNLKALPDHNSPEQIGDALNSARSPRSPSSNSDVQSSRSEGSSSSRDMEELSTSRSGSMANILADLNNNPNQHGAGLPDTKESEISFASIEDEPESMASMVSEDQKEGVKVEAADEESSAEESEEGRYPPP